MDSDFAAFALSRAWEDTGTASGVVVAVIGAGYAVFRVVKSVWRMASTVAQIADDVSETKYLTRYHLGPNGTTTPIHARLSKLEHAHGLEDGSHDAAV